MAAVKKDSHPHQMYKTLIRPVFLYGYETRMMLEEDLQALGVFESQVFRTIFGGVQEVYAKWIAKQITKYAGQPD